MAANEPLTPEELEALRAIDSAATGHLPLKMRDHLVRRQLIMTTKAGTLILTPLGRARLGAER